MAANPGWVETGFNTWELTSTPRKNRANTWRVAKWDNGWKAIGPDDYHSPSFPDMETAMMFAQVEASNG